MSKNSRNVATQNASFTGIDSHRSTQFVVCHDYHDHSSETEHEFMMTKLNDSKKDNTGGVRVTFPKILHFVLSNAAEYGFDHIVSW